ncbi:MAG: NAD(P)/FAD-dependent oxidoreductase [Thermoplasmata archaeon]
MYKVVIIGAGIIGSSIARILSKYDNLKVTLIEKEIDVGWGVTKANTGIIHPGHEDDPETYPLRAELCIKGNSMWRDWTKDLDIPVKWPGELMLARSEEELSILEKYMEIGKKNGVTDLNIINRDDLREMEPEVCRDIQYALWAPSAGLIAPWEAVIALGENAAENGVDIRLDTTVEDIEILDGKIDCVVTDGGTIDADIVINSAGLVADEVSSMVGINNFKITPRKGEYYLFDEDVKEKPRRILHLTPTEKTKGVYAVQTIEGNLMLGPTAEELPEECKDERSTTPEGLKYVWENSKNIMEHMPTKDRVSKTFAGLRPEPPDGRYIIKSYHEPWGFINAAGIRSPGLTAAPAIAHKIKDLLIEELHVELIEKENWNPFRRRLIRFSELCDGEKKELIKKNEDYGRVVCMCKEVTKGEILEAVDRIHSLGGEVSLDGVKFRTLALFGFCQGSYCRARIVRILSDALGIPMWEVAIREKGTEYALGDIKSLWKD